MKQLWYGLWQEMYYYIAWPWRFLLELIIAFLLLIAIWEFCKWLSKILHLKKHGISLLVFLVTEFDWLVGRNTTWAFENDERIIDWGKKRLSEPSEKWYLVKDQFKKLFIVSSIITYILAVLPDLPFSSAFDSDSIKHLSGVKNFFQEKEAALSKGYEEYPHLFKVAEKKDEVENRKEGNKKISLELKKTGKKKVKLYKKPSVKATVLAKLKESDKIIYKNQCKKTSKTYWFKVYFSKKKVTGWIDSKCVKEKQAKKLLK